MIVEWKPTSECQSKKIIIIIIHNFFLISLGLFNLSILYLRLFASTWNVGGIPPSDALNLEDWLDTKNNSHDIYVLGLVNFTHILTSKIID